MKLILPKEPLHGVRDACPHAVHLSGSVTPHVHSLHVSPSCFARRESDAGLEGGRGTSAEGIGMGGNFIFEGEKEVPVV